MAPGMVAVVRGLQDAGLCVTLLDGARQYTLVPNAAMPQASQYSQSARSPVRHASGLHDKIHCNAGSQAMDGQYTSSYKIAHCNMKPTSPPVQLTEFPPQKAELYPGHGNFEIGGSGSGESCSPTRSNGSYRGGMIWQDRGSVRSPRSSHEPDAFANSLRKYPSMSPERSAEVVERFINYTQQKNMKITLPRSECIHNCEHNSRTGRPRYDSEMYPEQSPTRAEESRMYGRSHDVRCVRELPRGVMENAKNITYPYSHPVCPFISERYDHLPPDLKLGDSHVTTSVNMETQAKIPMVSKEVTTVPRAKPAMRNVAVPLSPSSSACDTKSETSNNAKYSSKSIQTKAVDLGLKTRKSVQTCFSSSDLLDSRKVKNKRKSKSQEELRQNYDLEDELIQFIQSLAPCPDFYTINALRSNMLRKINKIYKTDESERVNIKIGRCIKNQLYSEIDLKNFTRELSNELISKIKQHSLYVGDNRTNVYRADVRSFKKNHEENCIDQLIKEWLNDIPLRSINYFENDFQKDYFLETIAKKIRTLISNKLKYSSISTMKSDIIEIIDVIPIDISSHSKRFYLNRLVSELLKKIKATFISSRSRKRLKKATEFSNTLSTSQPTEKELNQFVTKEINEFMNKFNLQLCPDTMNQIEMEVTDIIINSIELMRLDKFEEVKDEIVEFLANFVNISEHQAIYFANNVIYNLKDMYVQLDSIDDSRSQKVLVLSCSVQNTQVQPCHNNTDSSAQGVSEEDIDANLDFYTNEIIKKITEWANNIKGFDKIDANFKQVVIHDLASDIVDRHKYLELNPSSKKTEIDELEHLKYQIFKWMNKVVGEDNLEMINHASELMEKLNSIPVPMLTKPQQTSNTKPSCCQNLNDMPGTSKTKTVQSTTKERRVSNPDHNQCQINATSSQQLEPHEMPEIFEGSIIMTAKQLREQQRRQSSPAAISVSGKPCCKQNQIANQNESSCGDRNENILHESNKNALPTVSDKAQIRTRHDTNKSPSRRMSEQSEVLSRPKGGANVNKTSDMQNNTCLSSPKVDSPNKTSCCTGTSNKTPLESPTVKQLNDEYDEFVKDWVEQIPIATSNPEEEALAQKARLGIYNGIWKAITKLKMNPGILSNPFYYQDILDDEIEELLSYLPQTEELNSKKALLKSQLLEKTTNSNQLILNAAKASTFKQQLVENISNNLPRNEIDYKGKDVAKLYEDMQKMNLAEDFILYTKYREENRTKANVFKKKLMKEVQELIKLIKQNHGKELKDIDAAVYIDEVFAALQKVPLPSEDTIREEADEITIGHEIEQWFMDLPLMPNDDYIEQLGRRRYKDSLAKKIHDMEKQSLDADFESQVREEIRRFLEKMPIRPDERININFMAEELVNRLKNRPNDILADGRERRNAVCFTDAFDYDEFSRDMPICSSFSDSDKPAQVNERSYMIADGNRVEDIDYYGGQYPRNIGSPEESEQQWYTLQESTSPRPKTQSGQAMPSCCQSHQERRASIARADTLGQPITQSTSCQTPTPMRVPERSESPQYARTFDQGYGCPPLQQGSQMPRSSYGLETAIRDDDFERRRNSEAGSKGCRSSAPATHRDASTRPILSQTPEFQQHYSRKISSADYCEPMGFSTPQSIYPPTSSIPKKKTREVEKSSREAARRRLEFEKSDNDSEEEVGCRCMEKLWRCRRKKPVYPTCEENGYVPCFMRFPPHPYFFYD